MQSIARNLGLAYLSEGKAEEARPLLRSCLEALERELRPDMSEGDECVELIEPLMLLSYTDMLAGTICREAEDVQGHRIPLDTNIVRLADTAFSASGHLLR